MESTNRKRTVLLTLGVCLGLVLGAVAHGEEAKEPETGSRQIEPPAIAGSSLTTSADLTAGDAVSLRLDRSEGGVDAPLPRTVNFPLDVPASEIRPMDAIPHVADIDQRAGIMGKPDGRACVIVNEGWHVQSMVSSDSGASFSAESILPTGPPAARILGSAGDLEPGGDDVYVALVIADPGGDRGLQVVRSDDLCATWNDPVDLLRKGDATHGVWSARIAVNDSGRVAVVYREARGGDPYAMVSSDYGETWSAPVRLNSLASDGEGTLDSFAVDVDTSGVVHAAFAEDRGTGSQIFYTRSTNGGASFETEETFDALLTARENSANPIIVEAHDGSVLITFWDGAGDGTGYVYTLRSTNAGADFSLVFDRVFSTDAALLPQLFASPADGVVLHHVLDRNGNLFVRPSSDDGATWGTEQQLVATQTANANLSLGSSAAQVGRTDAGSMAIAWDDDRDGTTSEYTDVYLRISTDGGTTWGSEQRINGSAVGATETSIGRRGVAGIGSDDLVVVYLDSRNDPRLGFDVYSNRSPASSPAFTNEQRIDSDQTDRDVASYNTPSLAVEPPAVAAGGASRVYVAAATISRGNSAEIQVAVSDDGGYTIDRVATVSEATGEDDAILSRIEATSGGRAYVAFTQRNPVTGAWSLKFTKTDDGGQTWLSPVIDFGAVASSEYDMVALDGDGSADTVILTWSDTSDIKLSKSTDGGDTFGTPITVNTNTSGFNRIPQVCVTGDTAFVSFAAPDVQFVYYSVQLAVSTDLGDTFQPEEQLIPDGSGGSFQHAVDCYSSTTLTDAPGGYWVGLIEDSSSGLPVATGEFVEVVGGVATQLGEFRVVEGIPTADGVFCVDTEPGPGTCKFVTSAAPLVAETSQSVLQREYDSDGTLQSEIYLTDEAPLPEATSQSARVASDGSGNVWVSWLDDSAGTSELVVRHSADGGDTYGDVYRISRIEPQGTSGNAYYAQPGMEFSAAADGEAFFVCAGEREGNFFSTVLNAFDTDDFDRDQSLVGEDCNDSDASALAVPTELTGFDVSKSVSGVVISWDSQSASAGAGTVYDLVKGLVSELRGSGGFSGANCLVDDESGSSFEDTDVGPAASEAFYYLGRAQNSCGASSYGDSTLSPDPRDDLDTGGPCP